jgi:hypothetical protein
MRGRKLRAALAVGVVALVVGIAMLVRGPDPSSQAAKAARATFSRIKPGMPLSEVTAILGPPGIYCTVEMEVNEAIRDEPADTIGDVFIPPKDGELWMWNTHSVNVSVDDSDKVTFGVLIHTRPKRNDRIDQLARWARRQWREWFPDC